ncbi:MAG: hypothetical protein AB7P94_17995 [Steroidobacteraceae bacterium]
MTTDDVQAALANLFDTLADARDEIEGDDDDTTLADLMRDLAGDLDEAARAVTFESSGLLTRNDGIVLRTSGGDEFQITIVQSRFGSGERGRDGDSDE